MKKLVLLIIFVLFLSFSLQAHNKGDTDLAIQPAIAIPLGNFGDVYGLGFGAKGTFSVYLSHQFAFTGSLGYLTWGVDNGDGDFTTIPLLAGARIYFSNAALRPYLSGEIGMHFWNSTVETLIGEIENDGSDFGAGFGAGFTHTIGRQLMLDIGAKYDMIFTEGESTNNLVITAGISLWFK